MINRSPVEQWQIAMPDVLPYKGGTVVCLTKSLVEKGFMHGPVPDIVEPVDFDKFVAGIKDLGLYWLPLNQPPLR